MAYDEDKPAGGDSIQSSDQEIRANWAHLADAIGAGHVWDITTAGNVLHNWYFGEVDKVMTDADASTTVVSGVGFTPQVVLLFGLYVDSAGQINISVGGHDGTNDASVYVAHASGTASDAGNSSNAIRLYDNSLTASQSGTVTTLGADGFTITWGKTGSPTLTASIFYACFGKGT